MFKVKCKKCGTVRITNACNIKRFGCKKCSIKHRPQCTAKTNSQFIKECNKIHGNYYDYSKCNYIQNKQKIIVICPHHGEFSISPNKHLYSGQGCPICSGSNLEVIVNNILLQSNLDFNKQVYINYNNKRMFVDFVININGTKYFIEVNGQQHYKPISLWGGTEKFKNQQLRDNLLQQYCNENHIQLF